MLLARSSLSGSWNENSSLELARVPRRVLDARGYYGMLGVPCDASEEEVREAGRRLMMETHPDRGGSAEAFMAAVEAYKTLSDPRLRAEYDAYVPRPKTAVRTEYSGFKSDFTGVSGEPAWYKEPTLVLGDEDVRRVRLWHEMVLGAARDFRQSLIIKVGVCRCPAGYCRQDDIALIGVGTEPERWAAYVYVLGRMIENE